MTQIGWSPLLPVWLLVSLGGAALFLALLGLFKRTRGIVPRTLAFLLVLLWLAGPQARHPVLRSLPQEALVLVDRSPSMSIGERNTLTARALDRLKESARGLKDLTLHVVEVPGGHGQGTRLFEALARETPALPNLAGVLMITDGMDQETPTILPSALHDARGQTVPLHLLLAAKNEEHDRVLRLLSAPPYVIVGQKAHLRVQADDLGAEPGAPVEIDARLGGEKSRTVARTVSGQPVDLTVPVTHSGQTLEELTASPLAGEVSRLNNATVLRLQGVRDRLRVLLVSGVPNQGARVWRQLLKADPSVDLVHFTILRSPETEDDTPLSELALIPFPTHELFEQKIRSFDLIILDGFRNRNILPDAYLRNIANYVRDGGGLLVVSGPELTQTDSLQDTPLGAVLPAHVPQNGVETGVFHPRPTALGRRHPVTDALPPSSSWGPWYRLLRPDRTQGETLLEAGNGQPLLILDRVSKGRVAMLLSDQVWLWSRGAQNSGPQAELLRRLAHWLMKEPELEENRLEASFKGNVLVIRRTASTVLPSAQAHVTAPDGKQSVVTLAPVAGQSGVVEGKLVLSKDAEPARIWVIRQGELTAYAAAPPENPIEDRDLRATATLIGPLARKSGGGVFWLGRDVFPTLRQVASSESLHGGDWAGLPRRHAELAGATRSTPLLPGWAALPCVLFLLALGWRREGR